jgi:Mg2+ and Co2+ transporter CorA
MNYLSINNLKKVVLARKQIDFNSKGGNIMIDELTDMINKNVESAEKNKNAQKDDGNVQNDDSNINLENINNLDREISEIKQNSEKIKIEKELIAKSYNDALNNFDIVYAKKISAKLKDIEDKLKNFDDSLKSKEQILSDYKEKQLKKNDEITATSEYQDFFKKFGE